MNTTFQDYYNRHAQRYARRFNDGKMPFHENIQLPIFRSYIGTAHYRRCLDVGCGIGYYTTKIASQCEEVVGIDISESMLSLARTETHSPNIEYVCGDIRSFTKSIPFDLILAGFMPSYFSDPSEFFEPLAALLTDEGILITSTLHPLRMAARDHSKDRLIVREYLRRSVYESDFLSTEEPLLLHRHSFSTLHNAARRAGLCVERMDEPPLSPTTSPWMPSIVTYRIKRREHVLARKRMALPDARPAVGRISGT